jgi:HD-GYP domain-containing protein (c-di-GMP phosphodiesterase class II)
MKSFMQGIEDIPLYNSRIIDTYIKLLRKKYPFVDIDELLSYAQMKDYEVADPGHWFSQYQIDLFHQKLVELTGNEAISREAGRYAASPEALGHIGHWIFSFMDPATAFTHFSKIIPRFTRSSTYEARKIHAHKVEIKVTPKKNVNEKEFQCENRIGHFEAIVRIFKCAQPVIQHPECIFRGDDVCRYLVTWKDKLFISWKKIRNIIALGLILVISIFAYINSEFTFSKVIPSALIAFIAMEILFSKKEINEKQNAIHALQDSSDQLIEQSNKYYENALLASEIGEKLAKQTERSKLYSELTIILKKRLDYDRGLILIANRKTKQLEFVSGYGYTYEEYNIIKNSSFSLDKTHSTGAFVVCFKEKKPFLINNIDAIQSELSPRSFHLARKLNVTSFICCPIAYENTVYGVLAVDNVQTKRPLVARDMNLLLGIAHFLGISLRNIDLIDSKERQFESLLRVLAASIDARDALTAGHSEKVAEYAVGISRELGMSEESQYLIRVAALLHDYGKIGVPDSILKKPDKLSPDEYEIVKTHASTTEEILQQIKFEGVLEDVPRVAGSHHERLDGTGYPRGLKGGQIPREAQIIGVADFFEAVTSTRHYREPMPTDVAFAMLLEKCGSAFDAEIVAAFQRYFLRFKP